MKPTHDRQWKGFQKNNPTAIYWRHMLMGADISPDGVLRIKDGLDLNAQNLKNVATPVVGATIVVAASDSKWKDAVPEEYRCDGVNDQEVINRAINALPSPGTTNIRGSGEVEEPSQGGCVLLLDGTYNITAPIDLTGKSNVMLKGQGASTVINNLATDGSHAIQAINSTAKNRVVIKDLLIQGNPNSGDGIHIEGISYNLIDGVFCIYNGGSGLYVDQAPDGTGQENRIISNSQFLFNCRHGIEVLNVHETLITGCHMEENDQAGFYAYDAFDQHLCNCSIEDNYGTYQVEVENARQLKIANCMIEGDVRIAPYTDSAYIHEITGTEMGTLVYEGSLTNSYLYVAGSNLRLGNVKAALVHLSSCHVILPGAGDPVVHEIGYSYVLAGCQVRGGDVTTISLAASDAVAIISGSLLYGCKPTIQAAAGANTTRLIISGSLLRVPAIDVSGVHLVQVGSSIISGNGSLSISGGDYVEVTGNLLWGVGYPLTLSLSSSDGLFANNYLTSGVSVSLSGIKARGNKGYATENSGSATIDASGSVTVDHGLISAPSIVIVTPRGNIGSVWVTNVTSTQFTINCSSAPSSDTQVDWYAEV